MESFLLAFLRARKEAPFERTGIRRETSYNKYTYGNSFLFGLQKEYGMDTALLVPGIPYMGIWVYNIIYRVLENI